MPFAIISDFYSRVEQTTGVSSVVNWNWDQEVGEQNSNPNVNIS